MRESERERECVRERGCEREPDTNIITNHPDIQRTVSEGVEPATGSRAAPNLTQLYCECLPVRTGCSMDPPLR